MSAAAKKRARRRALSRPNVRRLALKVFQKAARLVPGYNAIERAGVIDIPWQVYLDLYFGRKPLQHPVLVRLAYVLSHRDQELAAQAVHASSFLLEYRAWAECVDRSRLRLMRKMYLEDVRRFLDIKGAGTFDDLSPWAQASVLFRRESRREVVS
jgi:hypothetical protein